MKRKILLTIDSGKTTCMPTPTKYCKHYDKSFGQPVCQLFHLSLRGVQRCDECFESEGDAEDIMASVCENCNETIEGIYRNELRKANIERQQ